MSSLLFSVTWQANKLWHKLAHFIQQILLPLDVLDGFWGGMGHRVLAPLTIYFSLEAWMKSFIYFMPLKSCTGQ